MSRLCRGRALLAHPADLPVPLTCVSSSTGDEDRGASTSSGAETAYAAPAPPRPPMEVKMELPRPAEPSRLLEMLTSESHGSPAVMSRPGPPPPPPPPHPLPQHPLQHPHPHPAHPRVPCQPGESRQHPARRREGSGRGSRVIDSRIVRLLTRPAGLGTNGPRHGAPLALRRGHSCCTGRKWNENDPRCTESLYNGKSCRAKT